jgi:hypothetical protein
MVPPSLQPFSFKHIYVKYSPVVFDELRGFPRVVWKIPYYSTKNSYIVITLNVLIVTGKLVQLFWMDEYLWSEMALYLASTLENKEITHQELRAYPRPKISTYYK